MNTIECTCEAKDMPFGRCCKASQPGAEPVKLEEIEQYRMQMAGISTAALGYWKEGDGIHPDYDTPALRYVAKLYADYTAKPQASQPLTDEQIIGWVESGEYNVTTNDWASHIAFARAIEAAHGIGAQEGKP